MPVTVVVGGQFGSEGKGKVAHHFARTQDASIVVRVGGTNSGHTVVTDSGRFVFRQLPTAVVDGRANCILPAGSYIDPSILFSEIESSRVSPSKVLIDPNAAVVTDRERREEELDGLKDRIGSTLSGTGAAVRRRISRDGSATLARDVESLAPFIVDTRDLLRAALSSGHRVLIEGTQGFGLSVLHSEYYPYTTSRDTSAAAFISESGLSPLDVDQVILVLRSFPIRVAGRSGDLPNEIDWNKITNDSGSKKPIVEHTSVSQSVRRVAFFHPDVVRAAIVANAPTAIVLNHLDYIDASVFETATATKRVLNFIDYVEREIGENVDYIGHGPASLRCTNDLGRLRQAS